MRLELRAAQGVPAPVTMGTHTGVYLYHGDLLKRAFLGVLGKPGSAELLPGT